MKIYRLTLAVAAFFSIVGWGPFSFFSMPSINESPGTREWVNKEVQIISREASNLDPSVLKLSLNAYLHARKKGMDHKELVTIIDYTKPSNQRRLWVIDLRSGRVLFNTWVTHGRNSGEVSATSFSNQPGSLKSSIGVFLTTNQTYVGGVGYALRLRGLEAGINDNAYSRDIVFHGAWYASGTVAKKYGFLGRSWGCPAVGEDVARPLINTIRDNTLVIAYYSDRHWMRSSTYLAG